MGWWVGVVRPAIRDDVSHHTAVADYGCNDGGGWPLCGAVWQRLLRCYAGGRGTSFLPFGCRLAVDLPLAPLLLRSQASFAPLAGPRLLRAGAPVCSWLPWSQDNPEPNTAAAAGRAAVAAVS